MKSGKKIDMTKGSIVKLTLLFALPLIIGNVLQQLYSTVDTLVVGNYCGSISIAAVGTSAQPVEILLCVFLGLSSGVSIIVSQAIGKGDNDKLKRISKTATWFLYITAIPLSIVGVVIAPLLLKLLQVPDDTFSQALAYLNIIFIGTLGNMGYNMNAGILRGVGDSRSTLIFLSISCVINIVLDLLFIAVFRMDVAGAALATIIAMFVSWGLSIMYIKKKYPELGFTFLPRKPEKDVLKEIISIGLPLGLNSSLYSVGHVFAQAIINAQGSAFIAACSVSGRVTGIANVAITSLASAATTYAGQNLGAQNYKRIKQGGIRIPFMSGFVTMMGGIICMIFSQPILRAFTNDPAVLDFATRYVSIVLPFTWVYATFNSIINYANGLGEVKYPTVINILMLWVVRIPICYAIDYFWDGTYLMIAYPVSFAFGLISMLFFYRTKKWREIVENAKCEINREEVNREMEQINA